MPIRNVAQTVVVFFIILLNSGISYPFELNPTEEQIKNAIEHGKSHLGGDIFESDSIKPARFGNWPSSDGGIVESKLVYLTIVSAMRTRANMPDVSRENIDAIIKSSEMPIRISSTKKVFNVTLKQGDKVIESSRIEKAPEMPPGGQDKQLYALKVFFDYSKLDPKGGATLVLHEDFGETEFVIDFSKFD